MLDKKSLYLVKSSPKHTSVCSHKKVIQLAVTKQSQLKSGGAGPDLLMLNVMVTRFLEMTADQTRNLK